MSDTVEWPTLEACREQYSLTFYKVHSCRVGLDKDKYLTPAPNIRKNTLNLVGLMLFCLNCLVNFISHVGMKPPLPGYLPVLWGA